MFKLVDLTSTNCVLTSDFRGVPFDKFRQLRKNNGEVYYEIHYHLNVVLDGAIMRFSCEVDGQELGAVEAKYD